MKVSKHQIRSIIQEEVARAKSLLQEADVDCSSAIQSLRSYPPDWESGGVISGTDYEECMDINQNCDTYSELGYDVLWDDDANSPTYDKCIGRRPGSMRHAVDCNDPAQAERWPQICAEPDPPPEAVPPGSRQPPGVAYLDNDPGCFDGRSSSYTHDGRDYGDWIYKIAGYEDGPNPYFEMVEKFGGMEQAAASDIGWIEMEVYKVTERGTSGRASANAKCSRTGFKFKLSDIKPRDSEEASHWTVHPLTRQVLGCINNSFEQWNNFTIECPPGVCS